jgi:oxygen-independent coproporphyrinogen III oxidase
MALGLYISVPFCRTKCSYCNFASDVFSRAIFDRYVARVCDDLKRAESMADGMGGRFERAVDSVYLGGGTPSVLESQQLERLFTAIRQSFSLLPGGEVTVECAPGTLTPALVETLVRCGVNRVSLGVQSFVDREAAAVGRLHTRETVLKEIAGLREAGIVNINVDLIAGLPHQTAESWELSLAEASAIGVPHLSVYMLEVDEDSRLGREVMAGGTRYHAHFVPDEGAVADFYGTACEKLEAAGIHQYEISNFARDGAQGGHRAANQSRHNLKYWTRQPYLGFGVDAHSMLKAVDALLDSVRFATADSLEAFVRGGEPQHSEVSSEQALEESFFLGLRLGCGVDLGNLALQFSEGAVAAHLAAIDESVQDGLLVREGGFIRLTPKGRLLSNEVFERFVGITMQKLTAEPRYNPANRMSVR